MRMHGRPGWTDYPSCLDQVVPRILELLERHKAKATFFVVGQDAALAKNEAALRSIVSAGHEIGNHSFHHEPWLHTRTAEEIEADLARAEEHLERVTGRRPVGFRSPGCNVSDTSVRVTAKRGYLYDSSTLPNILGPLAQAYFYAISKLSPAEKAQRKNVFGTLRNGLRPLRPYRWQLPGWRAGEGLIEVPVTTMPVLRLPIHLTYILYLSSYSVTAALLYFRLALFLCRLMNIQPSILLHSLDFLGREDSSELAFFPGMGASYERKLRVLEAAIRLVSTQYEVVTMEQFAQAAVARQARPMVQLAV
jgi:hypothetical protein